MIKVTITHCGNTVEITADEAYTITEAISICARALVGVGYHAYNVSDALEEEGRELNDSYKRLEEE
jgi:hypothetical protein